jgi:hypothetical protein
MKRVLVLLIVVALGYSGYSHLRKPAEAGPVSAVGAGPVQPGLAQPRTPTPEFRCDGRTRCAEMRSCDEATYFLEHCPGVKMDGDGDRIPCERGPC